jgi:hypothetical protein
MTERPPRHRKGGLRLGQEFGFTADIIADGRAEINLFITGGL